jgi:hypothetical protein
MKLFLMLILAFFVSQSAFASDSITYSIASTLISVTETFSLDLYYAIAESYRPLYLNIASIGLIAILSKYLLTRVAPLREMVSFTLSMIISSSVAFDVNLFQELIYDTFFNTLYAFDQFVIQSSAQNMPSISGVSFSAVSSLSGLFQTVDRSLIGVSDFALEVAHNNSMTFGNLAGFVLVKIEAYLIWFLFLFIGVYFLIIFTISIFGAHMMMILMPITISFYPFKRFRHYLSNCFGGMMHYALVTVFACVAISIVIFITGSLVDRVEVLRAALDNSGEAIEIPADFLTASIMIGFVSIFLIKVSTEFASRVLNNASSQLGGAFPMIVSAATTAAKAAPSISTLSSVGPNMINRFNNKSGQR